MGGIILILQMSRLRQGELLAQSHIFRSNDVIEVRVLQTPESELLLFKIALLKSVVLGQAEVSKLLPILDDIRSCATMQVNYIRSETISLGSGQSSLYEGSSVLLYILT